MSRVGNRIISIPTGGRIQIASWQKPGMTGRKPCLPIWVLSAWKMTAVFSEKRFMKQNRKSPCGRLGLHRSSCAGRSWRIRIREKARYCARISESDFLSSWRTIIRPVPVCIAGIRKQGSGLWKWKNNANAAFASSIIGHGVFL